MVRDQAKASRLRQKSSFNYCTCSFVCVSADGSWGGGRGGGEEDVGSLWVAVLLCICDREATVHTTVLK